MDRKVLDDDAHLGQLIDQADSVLKAALNNNQDMMNILHVAAMFGKVEFVKKVLDVRPDLCLAGDRLGRNPLHLAVIRGRSDVVEELIKFKLGPAAAQETADGGGNVLHLCVKYDQLAVLKLLLGAIKDRDFAHRKDDQGMTILHLAVFYGLKETVKELVGVEVEVEVEKKCRVDVNTTNAYGSTALDLCHEDTDKDIPKILILAGAKRGSTVKKYSEWLTEQKRTALYVVTTLVAGMAFQAGTNPAGGVWQEDSTTDHNDDKLALVSPPPSSSSKYSAGEAVMACKHRDYYVYFLQVNTVAFVSSLSIILLLISGLPFRSRFFSWVLNVVMWLTITAIALTYSISIVIVTPKSEKYHLSKVINIAVMAWCGVMSLLLFGNIIRLINKWRKRRRHGINMWDRPRILWNSAFKKQICWSNKPTDEKC